MTWIESNYAPVKTASGTIAHFSDGADDVPLKSLTAQIVPKQEGTGDPSPTNPRPISGTSVLDIYHSGADTSNPTIYSIALGRTVYGGSAEVVGGTGEVTWGIQSVGSINFTKEPTCQHTFRRQGLPRKFGANNYNLISSVFKTYTSGHSTGSNISSLEIGNDFTIFLNSGSNTFYIVADSSYDDKTAEEFQQAFQDIILAYELATPTDFTFTGQEINSLEGVNNVWTDTGDTEVEYEPQRTNVGAFIASGQIIGGI